MEVKTDTRKKCMRCGKLIGKKDNFCRLTEWRQGIQIKEGWYHTLCFREGMHGTKDEKVLKTKANVLMDRTFNLLNHVESKI